MQTNFVFFCCFLIIFLEMQNQMLESNISLRKQAAYISMAVGIGMFISKITAFYITQSAAIFSDAIESIVHILATGMALYSILLSSKPADSSHPYGHSNIEYFSSGIEGLLIIIAAIGIIYYAVLDLISGQSLNQLDIGIIIISSAGAINLVLGLFLIKRGKKTNSLTLIADGKHVLTDSYTSLGVIIGIFLVIITGITQLDPIFAILVASNILYTGYQLMREAVAGLMHEIDEVMLKNICDKLEGIKKDFWIDLHELRFWKSGEHVFIDFHLTLPFYYTIAESHTEEVRIASEIKSIIPTSQIKIHFDNCTQHLCKFCSVENCTKRFEAKSVNVAYTDSKMIGLPLHKNIDD